MSWKTIRTTVALPFLLLIPFAGCIVKEAAHTLYLEPDGSLTWTVLENQIRSDHELPEDRQSEEAAFLDQAYNGDHDVARALAFLRPTTLDSKVLRATRPYTVTTSASFRGPDEMVLTFLGNLALRGDAVLEVDGNLRRLTVIFDGGQEVEDSEAAEILGAVVDDLEDYRIVLVEGRFTHATGFRITEQGRAARILEPEDGDLERVVYSLTWTLAG